MVCLKQKDSSTLSTNAVIERVFSQGRRMWPLARESADPASGVCGRSRGLRRRRRVANSMVKAGTAEGAGRQGCSQTCPRGGGKPSAPPAPKRLRPGAAGAGCQAGCRGAPGSGPGRLRERLEGLSELKICPRSRKMAPPCRGMQVSNAPTWRPVWNLGTFYWLTVPGLASAARAQVVRS